MNTSALHQIKEPSEPLNIVKMKKKERHPRRSKIALQRDVLDAVASIVEKDGFFNINLTSIAEESDVAINTIIRNFTSLDRLLDRYAQIFDYWYDDIVRNSHIESQDGALLYGNILKTIAESLYRDKGVRQLLLWEMTEENETTRRVEHNRERTYQRLFKEYDALFQSSGLDIESITALIVGGVNYLTFRRKRTQFLGVDYSTSAGKERLIQTVTNIVGLIFSALEERKGMLTAARKLRAKGVDASIISECCGVDIESLEAV